MKTAKFSVVEIMQASHFLFDVMKNLKAEYGNYAVFYCEEKLYCVYDTRNNEITLVYANNQAEAVGKVKQKGITMNISQIGGNSCVVGHVEKLTL